MALLLIGAGAACRTDGLSALGPPDSYVVLVPASGPDPGPQRVPVFRKLDATSAPAQPLTRLLVDGFASEMLRTVYLAKQFVREADLEGRRFPDAGRALAAHAFPIAIGLDRTPYGRGFALDRWWGPPLPHPTLVWLALPDSIEKDMALVQTLSGRLAVYALHLLTTGGTFQSPQATLPAVLSDGYRMAMEVIAREWRIGKGPNGVVPHDAGTTAQRTLFADIRENRFVLAKAGAPLRSADQLLADPGVAATAIYRMAQSRTLAQRPAAAGFYAPFVTGRVPDGVSPAAVLGAFRNFQAKLLGAWGKAVLRGKPPRDIVDLIEMWGREFPAERAEATRLFVVTTFGATIKADGVSTRPADASASLAEIDALVAEVGAGRRSLRDATTGRTPASK